MQTPEPDPTLQVKSGGMDPILETEPRSGLGTPGDIWRTGSTSRMQTPEPDPTLQVKSGGMDPILETEPRSGLGTPGDIWRTGSTSRMQTPEPDPTLQVKSGGMDPILETEPRSGLGTPGDIWRTGSSTRDAYPRTGPNAPGDDLRTGSCTRDKLQEWIQTTDNASRTRPSPLHAPELDPTLQVSSRGMDPILETEPRSGLRAAGDIWRPQSSTRDADSGTGPNAAGDIWKAGSSFPDVDPRTGPNAPGDGSRTGSCTRDKLQEWIQTTDNASRTRPSPLHAPELDLTLHVTSGRLDPVLQN
ncbi:hypothetical protein NDU88_005714 [Pleurodeles waltl]|uniref:Uncharacterized protein n=1 Tax=Pleurodeles waltl TaxID=8319 RepID=A0AAV7L3U8_PLEWA|nr:hypothetical protein NDU88_005714 [Pleurodeles waltl]